MKLVLIDDKIETETILINSFKSDCVVKNIKNYQNSMQLISEIENIEEITHFVMVYFFEGKYEIPYFKESGESSYKYFNVEIMNLITLFKGYNPQIKIDILTCNMNDPEFVQTVAKLEEDFEIDIRYSLDQTGNNPQGNWILESDGVNIKDLYFNESINLWKNKLDLLISVWAQKGGDINGEYSGDINLGETAGDQSGYSVSLSSNGNTIAIGSRKYNTYYTGKIRVYNFFSDSWYQLGDPFDGGLEGNYTKYSIDINSNGDIVAVGTYYLNNNYNYEGYARIYYWNGMNWNQLGNGNFEGNYSYNVSLSSNGYTIAMGILGTEGIVRIYDLIEFNWTQRGNDLLGENNSDNFGHSISLSSDGNTIAIGANQNDGNGSDSGHVRIYDWSANNWIQRGLDIDGETIGDQSGFSVSLSSDGNTVAISSPVNTGNSGHVRIYDWSANSWTQRGNDIDGEAVGDQSGFSISLSSDGNTIAIGAFQNDGNGSDSGHVRIYKWKTNVWAQIGYDINGETADDRSGYSVSLSSDGNTVAIGAPNNDGILPNSNVGHVRVYQNMNTNIDPSTYSFSSNIIANSINNQINLIGSDTDGFILGFKILSVNDISFTDLQDYSGNTIIQNYIYPGSSIFFTPQLNVTGIKSFNYTLIDNNGTESFASTVTLNINYNPVITISSVSLNNATEIDASNGSITLNSITGGNGNYTYIWSGPNGFTSNTQNISNLFAGTYTINITDNIGSSGTESYTIFDRASSYIWVQKGGDIDGEATDDQSGFSVSLSSNGYTVAIGANQNDGNGSNSGHVRIYDWSANSWTQRGSDINGEAANDQSGYSISLSSDGNTVAIGAPLNDGSGNNSGHVRIYDWSANSWTQRGNDIDGEAIDDQSGYSVNLSSDGNTIAIGAPFNKAGGTSLSYGHVRIYYWNGSSWVKRGNDIDGETTEDQSGFSVSLSSDGNTVAIGAPFNDAQGGFADNRGHVRIYVWNGSSWIQKGVDIDGEEISDRNGYSVSLSSDGNTIAIGAIYNNGNEYRSGHVRIYDWSANIWTKRGNDIDGETTEDQSGYSVSLSSNGNTVAIGANGNDGNGLTVGHVRIYDWNGSNWTKRGNDIDGENDFDNSGFSVSLSSDGNIVAVGAPYNGDNGSYSGHVRIYESTSIISPVSYNTTINIFEDILNNQIDLSGIAQQSTIIGYKITSLTGITSNLKQTIGGASIALNTFYSGTTLYFSPLPNIFGTKSFTFVLVDNYNLETNESTVTLDISNNYFYDVSQIGSDINGEAAGDQSGFSVSLSSNGYTVAIGANLNDGNGSNSGHVRIYDWSANIWTQRGSDINGEAAGDGGTTLTYTFPISLSSTGNTIAIGAAYNDGGGTSTSDNRGHVRIYDWSANSWTKRGIDIDGEAAGDQSGFSVSLSSDGNTVAIGANQNDGNGSNSGHVRIYDWNGSSWTQRGNDIDGEAAGDQSGYSISLSSNGNTIAIGAPYNDGNGSNSGHVRIYDWNGSSWTKRGNDIDGEAISDQSGFSVSLSSNGNTIAIGANLNDGNGSNSGHARIYDWNGSSWTKRGLDIDGEAISDFSGDSISLSSDGNTVAIGADFNDASGNASGHVRIYKWNGVTWKKICRDIDGEAISDQSGYSVSLSSDGKTVAIGAPKNDAGGTSTSDNRGHVRVYQLSKRNIYDYYVNQIGLDINGEAAGDQSGYSISLSSNGNTIAIGAPYNDGNGSNSGHVRIYDWNGSSWTKRGNDIDGEAISDQSGFSVSLSSNGNTIAIGANLNDGNGSNSGHARIYDWNGSSWIQRGNDINGEAINDQSGYSLSLSSDGNTVAIGAFLNDAQYGINSGNVKIYYWNSSSWIQRGSEVAGEVAYDQSGFSVSLSYDGNTIAIGANFNDGTSGNSNDNRGHVRIYVWDGLYWTKRGNDIDGEATSDQSGFSVSLSSDGNTVAIGANQNDGNGSNSGHVRIYDWNGSSWTQRGNDIDGESTSDQSGYSVSLSSDGNTIAIGANLNDGNGNASGHVQIYKWNGISWNKICIDIDGEAAGDQSGYSISLNSNGNILAVGAPYNADNGSQSGHVRVYQILNKTSSDSFSSQVYINSINNQIDLSGSDTDGFITGFKITNVTDLSFTDFEDSSGNTIIQDYIYAGSSVFFTPQSNVTGTKYFTYKLINNYGEESNESTVTIGIINYDPITISSVSLTNPTTFGGSDGAINITPTGGNGNYTYSWSNGQTTQNISNLTAGSYTVDISDNIGSNETFNFVLTNPTDPNNGTDNGSNNFSPITINSYLLINPNFGSSNGSIDITVDGGNGNYTFRWSNGQTTQNISNLSTGSYTVDISDNSGNTFSSESFTLTYIYDPITISSVSLTNPTTINGSNGAINITPAGGNGNYTYRWSNGQTTQDLTGLGAGSYSVDISDNVGTTATFSYILNKPIFINDSSFTLLSIHDGSNATITVDISGGNGNYTGYSWTKNGVSYPDVSTNLINLTNGIYILTSVTDSSNNNFITTGNKFTIPNPPEIPQEVSFSSPQISQGTVITFPPNASPELVFTEPIGAQLTNVIENIKTTLTNSGNTEISTKLETGTNIKIVTLEPSGTTFSEYIGIPLTVTSTNSLFVFFSTGISAELVPIDGPNYTNGPYYTITNSETGEIMAYTKHFSELGFGNENGGIGDPFIKPIFGQSYYLPNDESTYLLFDNNDNLKIYTKTWMPQNLNKKISFMRYLIFDFNLERFCLDLESMNFVSINDSYKYISHKLSPIADPIMTDLFINRSTFTNYLNDYYGKNYKISSKNKQIAIKFNCNYDREIILLINSDLKYTDIRNNVNIKLVNIPIQTLKEYNGAFINEQKVKCIKYENTILKKLFK